MKFLDLGFSKLINASGTINIGANRPETPGTVTDLEHLSRVLSENEYLPQLSRNFTNPKGNIGSQSSKKATDQ